MGRHSAVKTPAKSEPLPVTDLCTLNVPLALDRRRFSEVRLDETPDEEFPRPPNRLLRVGDIRWLQDSAHDSFSDGRSIWQTLRDVVMKRKLVHKSRSAPLGIPTLMCHKLTDGHWYALDTRRTLVYKIAFHPDQRIPVHETARIQLVDEKQSSRQWSRRRACSVRLNLRLHEMVPHGVQNLAIIRNIAELAVHPPMCKGQRAKIGVTIGSASQYPLVRKDRQPQYSTTVDATMESPSQLLPEFTDNSEDDSWYNHWKELQRRVTHHSEDDAWYNHWKELQRRAMGQLDATLGEDGQETLTALTSSEGHEESGETYIHISSTPSHSSDDNNGCSGTRSGGSVLNIACSWMTACWENGVPSAKKAARILMDENPSWSVRELLHELRKHDSGVFGRMSFATGQNYHAAQLRRLTKSGG